MQTPLFKTRSFQLDLGRQPESLPTLKRMIAHAARFGFNQCHLYLENSLRLEAFGSAGRGLHKDEMAELIALAQADGVEIVPSLNLLSHAENFLACPEFQDLDEIREGVRQPWQVWHNCFCPSLPRMREWASTVIAETATLFPSTNLHVGLDETWTLGSCPLCRARAEEIGLGGIFADHATFLNTTVKAHGKRMWMWDDMCFYYGREVVLPRMPREIVLVDWHYGRIGDRPNFSFRNWEEIDCTRELIEAGFTVVPASALDPDNIATFVRYVQGLGCDTFLATNWEGTHRFPDSILPALAQAGNLLQSGNRAPWKVAGQRLLPNRSETERRDFLLTIQGEAPDPEPALEVLRRQPDCPTHQATRCALLQRFVKRELSDILDESDMAARQALRRGSDATAALAPVSRRLEKALESGREWLSLLDDLSKFYEESESDRGIYHQARHMVADLERRQGGIASFCKSPGRDTFFGDPVELALDIVIVDPCAHACRIEVGDRADRLQIVHKANCLPLGSDGTGRLTVPLKKQPKFIRISINGYARVGLATALIRTLESDGILPRRIIATGGLVIDAEHLLTWDRKAALFNEPDIPSKWLANDVDSDNFVLLEY